MFSKKRKRDLKGGKELRLPIMYEMAESSIPRRNGLDARSKLTV